MVAGILYVTLYVLQLAAISRVLLRPNREPSSRIAWIVVIALVPVLGIVVYLLVGETNIGRKRVRRSKAIIASLEQPRFVSNDGETPRTSQQDSDSKAIFEIGRSVNGFAEIGGNSGRLTADSNDAINRMVEDMDGAADHIHLTFYIWLEDNNGLKVVEALKRAAARGVTCRAMADGLGSRAMITSKHWRDLESSGVRVGVALPIGNPLLRVLHGRIDLRNHRKILVIDNRITYCGSQNCADPEFRVKPKYAPWVDAMIRFEGPVAVQNQCVFVVDWMTNVDEDIRDVLPRTVSSSANGFRAQVVATGPSGRSSAMPEMFVSLMFAAKRKLVITTPYYVPNEAIQTALCAAAYRGVETTIVFPARNDSFIVAAASRSCYANLLAAGVKIYEYKGGLLHTKSLSVDEDIVLIGSANMDRRSFDLNYENNIIFQDEELAGEVHVRQSEYLASSEAVSIEEVSGWSRRRRLWNNTVAMFAPLL